ncbi:MAG: hypothetical protein LBR86_07850 [Tannerella sp.]|jgi:hypothetical protein|nr:hypothetical protein [Tannerella sp.]
MKKCIVACVLAACLSPFPAAGQFGKITKKKLNGLFTARVDFSKMRVSFLRKFPRTYLVLEDFRMTGTGTFEGDTLVACRKVAVTFGLVSVIRRKHIKIKSVMLEEPKVYARVLADGQANWHILKRPAPPKKKIPPQPAPSPEPPPESRAKSKKARPQTKVSTGKIEICNADITFRNDRQQILVSAEEMDLLILEDKARNDSVAEWTVQLHVGDLDFRTGNRDRLQDMQVDLASKICSGPDKRIFRWDSSLLQINEMAVRLSGSAGRRDSGFITDLSFASENAGFKNLLSLVPAVRRQADFESLQTAGTFAFDGYVKGIFGRRQKPVAGLHIQLDSAFLRYPRLPEPVNNIRFAMNLLYDGTAFDRSTADLDSFHFELGGRPFDLALHVKTPQSDLQIAGAMKGMIRLDSLARAIPLPDDMQLTGYMECDLSLNGRMSALEKDSFDGFHAQGMLELSGITLTNPRFPEGADVPNLSVNFTPRAVKMLKSMVSGLKKKN